jgi:hypothetical protein
LIILGAMLSGERLRMQLADHGYRSLPPFIVEPDLVQLVGAGRAEEVEGDMATPASAGLFLCLTLGWLDHWKLDRVFVEVFDKYP